MQKVEIILTATVKDGGVGDLSFEPFADVMADLVNIDRADQIDAKVEFSIDGGPRVRWK